MGRVQIDAGDVARELAEMNASAARSLGVLRQVADARVGATPREAVFSTDNVTLYHYGGGAERAGIPLLVVYALVNRPEMADLQQGRSLIAALMARGFDVYLVDWGYPRGSDRRLGIADYVDRYLDACVDHLREALGRDRLPLLGICQGGTFSLCYAALNPGKIERVVATVTPVDFHTGDDLLSRFVRHIDVDALVDSAGNVPGDVLNSLFLALKPHRLLQQKYVHFAAQADDPEAAAMFLRMEQWIFDSPALAGRACREFARDFYHGNRLVNGGLEIGGRRVSLDQLTMPVLNIYARDDHLVPPAASRALGGLLPNADYTECELAGGHIGVYVGARKERSVPAVVEAWFRDAS